MNKICSFLNKVTAQGIAWDWNKAKGVWAKNPTVEK